ncbi:hypothetical protein XCR_3414 [Xanthomonas campestris pv. raphani 756C]|nr:hypothetical protein XCR_3414 [Xanthomonas campestris pv. raphani 756C]
MAVADALVGRALSLLAVTHVMAARRKREARLLFAKTGTPLACCRAWRPHAACVYRSFPAAFACAGT